VFYSQPSSEKRPEKGVSGSVIASNSNPVEGIIGQKSVGRGGKSTKPRAVERGAGEWSVKLTGGNSEGEGSKKIEAGKKEVIRRQVRRNTTKYPVLFPRRRDVTN